MARDISSLSQKIRTAALPTVVSSLRDLVGWISEALDGLQQAVKDVQITLNSAATQLAAVTAVTTGTSSLPQQIDPGTIAISVIDTRTVANLKQQILIQVIYTPLSSPTSIMTLFYVPNSSTAPLDASTMVFADQKPNGTPLTVWIDKPSIDTYFWFAIATSSAILTYGAKASLPGKAFLVSANSLSLQVSAFTVTVQQINSGGVPAYRTVYQFTAPVDVNYNYVLIERIATDAAFAPLGGAIYQDTGDHPVHTGDLQNNYQPDPPTDTYYIYRASAVNFQGQANVTIRPTVNVTIPGSTGLDLSKLNTGTMSPEFVIDPTTHKLTMAVIDLAKALNFDTNDFAISGSSFFVKAIAVNKLIAGTALFTSDVIFSRSGGGVVTINSSGVTIQKGTSTLTLSSTLISMVLGGTTLFEVQPSVRGGSGGGWFATALATGGTFYAGGIGEFGSDIYSTATGGFGGARSWKITQAGAASFQTLAVPDLTLCPQSFNIPALINTAGMVGDTLTVANKVNDLLTALGVGGRVVRTS